MARPQQMASGWTATAKNLPLGKDPASVRRRIEGMEHLLERSLTIPGTRFPIGLDVVLDFVPAIGPTIAAAMGAYMAWEATNLHLVASVLAAAALEREETRGSHWRQDFPDRDDEPWRAHLVARLVDGTISMGVEEHD